MGLGTKAQIYVTKSLYLSYPFREVGAVWCLCISLGLEKTDKIMNVVVICTQPGFKMCIMLSFFNKTIGTVLLDGVYGTLKWYHIGGLC